MSRKRRHFTPEEKVLILKRHLAEQVPVSDLCEEYGLHPNVFYRWQKEFFENGARAFEKKMGRPASDKSSSQIADLKERIARKDEVIAELMEDHVALKKKHGGR